VCMHWQCVCEIIRVQMHLENYKWLLVLLIIFKLLCLHPLESKIEMFTNEFEQFWLHLYCMFCVLLIEKSYSYELCFVCMLCMYL
jgi:hypothetical protein